MKAIFKDQTVLVTGANGFIGAHLVKTLEDQGANVFAQIRQDSDTFRFNRLKVSPSLIEMDLCDLNRVQRQVTKIRPHFVFNTAVNRNYTDIQASIKLNTLALFNLLESSRSPQLRGFVQLASSTEYGNLAGPLQETDLPAPCTPYGGAKLAGTNLLQSLARSQNLPVSILRLFHIYGPLEPHKRLIPTAIHNIKQGQPVKLTQPGCVHDPVYVGDVVTACLTAAQSNTHGELFNIANGTKIANEEIITMIASILEKEPIIEFDAFPPRKWDRDDWYADVAKAEQVLGWKAALNLRQGLSKTIKWMENHE